MKYDPCPERARFPETQGPCIDRSDGRCALCGRAEPLGMLRTAHNADDLIERIARLAVQQKREQQAKLDREWPEVLQRWLLAHIGVLLNLGVSLPDPWNPGCGKCGRRFPNGHGEYTSQCPGCGELWDGTELPPVPTQLLAWLSWEENDQQLELPWRVDASDPRGLAKAIEALLAAYDQRAARRGQG